MTLLTLLAVNLAVGLAASPKWGDPTGKYYGVNSEDGHESRQVCASIWVEDKFVQAMIQHIEQDGEDVVRFVTHVQSRDSEFARIYRSDFSPYATETYQRGRSKKSSKRHNPNIRFARNEIREPYYIKRYPDAWWKPKKMMMGNSFQDVFIAKFPETAGPYEGSFTTRTLSFWDNNYKDDHWESQITNFVKPAESIAGKHVTYTGENCQSFLDELNWLEQFWMKIQGKEYSFEQEGNANERTQWRIMSHGHVQSVKTGVVIDAGVELAGARASRQLKISGIDEGYRYALIISEQS